jgi:hypothetical protein
MDNELAPRDTDDAFAVMRAMQARYEREGGFYAGDPATGRIERLDLHKPRLRAQPRNAPRRAATTSRVRPRGRRATVRAAASRDGPSDEPPLAVIPPAEFRRQLQRALGGPA